MDYPTNKQHIYKDTNTMANGKPGRPADPNKANAKKKQGPQTKTFYLFYTPGPDGAPQVTDVLTNTKEVLEKITTDPNQKYAKFVQTAKQAAAAEGGEQPTAA
jgi:hypothetical protein